MINDARPITLRTPPLVDTLPLSKALSALDHVIAQHGPEQLLAKATEKSASDALAAALRELCAQARSAKSASAGAERMVIELHAAWPRLPAIRRLSPVEKPDALLDRIVSLAIAEFYAPTPTPGCGMDVRDETAEVTVSVLERP